MPEATANSAPGPLAATLVFINWKTPELTVAAARSAVATAGESLVLRTVIVDNNSGDNSLEAMSRELPDAALVALPENQGFARAANAGLARVTTNYALILNSDITFRPGAIPTLLASLDADPQAVLACPRLLRPDGREQPAAIPEPTLFWELVNRSLPRHWMRLAPDAPSPVPSIVGPCMVVRLDRVAAIGLFDPRFFFFFEETDWCRRIRRAGGRILFVPHAEVVHLQGESANRRPVRARVQFYQSRYRYFRKHGGPLTVALLFTGLLVRLLLGCLLQLLAVVFTGGRQRQRDRLAVTATLLLWHLCLCRPLWGFENATAHEAAARG